MLDKHLIPMLKPPLDALAIQLQQRHVSADQVTLVGFLIGLLGAAALALQWYWVALIALLFNRILDGVDGALARLNRPTDAGGFLDIVLDFIFYAVFVLGFALADPATNAVAAAFLICAFMGTGSSFLAFAIMAEKHQIETLDYGKKSLYFLGGITEGTETIVCFVLMCLLPTYFVWLAAMFAGMCWLTTAMRIVAAYRMLKQHA